MDVTEYIASGVLELYVYGSLSEKENEAVYDTMMKHKEVAEEVAKIEAAVMQLAAANAPYEPKNLLGNIKNALPKNETKVKALPTTSTSKTNWSAYIGWAASVALLIGLFSLFTKNKALRQELVTTNIDNEVLQSKIELTEENLTKTKSLLSILRNPQVIEVPLGAQEVAPEAFAAVYWDKGNDKAYVDVSGLPTPPPGKVYQVWSLTLDPLTPTSLGTLDDFTTDENKIFELSNANASEAFGITLEPAGGSPTPTMEQLYTLGVVASS